MSNDLNAHQDFDAVVVGAGLAGLSCAHQLEMAGKSVVVLEASDGVGGRVRSDIVDGFVLDRGFQVLLAAYPEAKRQLDYAGLDLRSFDPGALVQRGPKRWRVSDPFRRIDGVLASAIAPVGTPFDKARVALLRRAVRDGSLDQLWRRADTPTIEKLRALKFSTQMIDRFFRPLFGGVLLDQDLQASSRMFEFVFRMFSEGESVLPARGMQAIPDQLASRLRTGSIRLNSRVAAVEPGRVTLVDHGAINADVIVVATEGPQAAKLLGDAIPAPGSRPVSCLYFAADQAPVSERLIVLNGDGATAGPINNLCVPSVIAPAYAPPGKHLVSVSVLGSHSTSDDKELLATVATQLRNWFGPDVDRWDHLRTYHIAHAQPEQASLSPHERPVFVAPGLFVCGDHRDQASINGALTSGRRAAEAVLAGARSAAVA